jgi:aldehyde:ferredoxin oxidoreductase
MANGFWARILRVDLSSGKIDVEEPDEVFYRSYLGGRGFIAHYLLNEVPSGCDPLGPDNILILASSVLTGTALPGTGRNSAGAKSPLTGGYGEGEGGGQWGVRMKRAGFDGIVFTGQSETPVYLWIKNGTAELRDASKFWGMEALETQRAIQSEIDDNRSSLLTIGPAAERLVRFACLGLDCRNFIGRTGLGAVMGSKRLKAIALSGNRRPEVHDRNAVTGIARWLRDSYKATHGEMQRLGTSRVVAQLQASGGLPTRNFRGGGFEGYKTITGEHMEETILVDRESCYGCPVRCKRVVEIAGGGIQVSREYGGPEYETIGSFGSNCGISDLNAVAKANEICNRVTLDTITAGMMIAGAMECAEKGLLPSDLTEGMDLKFGSTRGMLSLLDQIIRREGLGDILAGGPLCIEKALGSEAASCFLHVKGQPIPMHEPRLKASLGVGYAISPTGADHMHNVHDTAFADESLPSFDAARNLGILRAVDNLELSPSKARLFTYVMVMRSLKNCLCSCIFLPFGLSQLTEQVKAVTGWNVSDWEMMKVSERALAMARAFNAREGYTADDDILPDRFFEPLDSGTLKGRSLDRKQFFDTRNLVYDMLGWGRQSGAPKRWKLFELGLDWLVEDLGARNLPDFD